MLKNQNELFDDDSSFGHEKYKFSNQKKSSQNDTENDVQMEQPA